MRGHEALVAVYFAFLTVTALVHPRARGRLATRLLPLLALGGAAATARFGSEPLRAWIPHLYLILGYWLPAFLAPPQDLPTRFEGWLRRTDERWRPRGRMPPVLQHLFELAYLLCYPLVPAAFAVVWTLGTAEDVGRFWTAVLASGFACYVSLPWLSSRPPRLVSASAPSGPIAALNVRVLGRVSHQMTTFPSGHVAVSLACAAGVFTVSVDAGVVFAIAATGITIGSVAGRYHYAIDAALGVLVAAAAASVAAFT